MTLAEHYEKTLPTGQSIVFLPNYGNAGDSVIAQATIDFFKRNSIPFIIDYDCSKTSNAYVTFGGGGGLTGAYPEPFKILETAANTSKHLTILPSSITKIPDRLIPKLKHARIFARESNTFSFLVSKLGGANVSMHDDMAFQLEKVSLQNGKHLKLRTTLSCMLEGTLKQRGRALKHLPQAIKHYRIIQSIARKNAAEINCFRTDIESLERIDRSNNFDISDLYKVGSQTKATIRLSTSLFARTLSWFDTINTDRLHCAITGAILGKKVNFHPNNYFKNKAVYEHSLRDRYPNVKWTDLTPKNGF